MRSAISAGHSCGVSGRRSWPLSGTSLVTTSLQGSVVQSCGTAIATSSLLALMPCSRSKAYLLMLQQ